MSITYVRGAAPDLHHDIVRCGRRNGGSAIRFDQVGCHWQTVRVSIDERGVMRTNKAEVLHSEDEARGITLRVPCLAELDEDRIRELLASSRFFWLDLTKPTE